MKRDERQDVRQMKPMKYDLYQYQAGWLEFGVCNQQKNTTELQFWNDSAAVS